MDPLLVSLSVLCALSVVNLILQLVLLFIRKSKKKEGEGLRETLDARFDAMELRAAQARDSQQASIDQLREALLLRTDRISDNLERNLSALRRENNQQLEQIRHTVDDKLRENLEGSLTKSFEQVSRQLESVYKGLGEMQGLAKDVGDLSRIFSNVKSRGVWGEVQAAAILGDILSPEQWVRNFHPRPRSPEVVEFAIRLPGRSEGDDVYLPIDSKFPKEDYEAYLKALDGGDQEKARAFQGAMRARVQAEARDICMKYIAPPRTTDFAILFLPSESLYAEVLSIPGFAEELQSKYRVTLSGPTTLAALVNSLQMGFRTLAVEKRSHEVWKLFAQMRKQFRLFSTSLEAAERSLQGAVGKIEDVSNRTTRIQSRLDAIELPEEADRPSDDNLLPDA